MSYDLSRKHTHTVLTTGFPSAAYLTLFDSHTQALGPELIRKTDEHVAELEWGKAASEVFGSLKESLRNDLDQILSRVMLADKHTN